MYPFNRLSTYRVKNAKEEAALENGIAALALDSQISAPTHDDSLLEEPEHTAGMMALTREIHSVALGMRPVLFVLRLMGFFPALSLAFRRHRWKRRIAHWALRLMSLSMIYFNANIYKHNIIVSLRYYRLFGFLHATTVSQLISGIKPLVNAVLILLFIWRLKEQKRMLKAMDSVNLCFRSTYHLTPNMRRYAGIFVACFLLSVFVPLLWRLIELHQLQNNLLMELASVVVVPLLTAWNILPLSYYVLCNAVIRFWCRTLRKSLQREHKRRHFSLKFYYEQFLRITTLQEAIGDTFNPFILFSLAWSLILLCLTIYFMTQPTSSLTEPISYAQQNNETVRNLLNRTILLNMGWSGLQIIVAILHICVISATGMKTNEETRKILTAVLAIVPDASADLDRFQISCFVHKMSTQYMWGMTVWRAFPLERTTFFTLVSVIITYSLLLLKLKDNPIVSPRYPIRENCACNCSSVG